MTSRSEWFRYFTERLHSAAVTPPVAQRRSSKTRVVPPHAVYRLEISSGCPSRKSTRKAANRQKNDVQFRMKQRIAEIRGRPPR